jgi:hypothetical protein
MGPVNLIFSRYGRITPLSHAFGKPALVCYWPIVRGPVRHWLNSPRVEQECHVEAPIRTHTLPTRHPRLPGLN